MSTDAKTNDRKRYRGFEPIALRVVVRIGCARLTFAELSELSAGTLVKLDSRVGSPFELLAGGAPLAQVEPIASDGAEGVTLKLVAAVEQEAGNDADS